MILIYGNGEFLRNRSHLIDWSQVTAIIDKLGTPGEKYNNVNVITPNQINNYDAQSIFIFSRIYFEEIKHELIYEYEISEDFIFSWDNFISPPIDIFHQEHYFIEQFVAEYPVESILDISEHKLGNYYLSKSKISKKKQLSIDCFTTKNSNFISSLYDDYYLPEQELTNHYDLVLIPKWDKSIDSLSSLLSTISNYLLVYISYIPSYDNSWSSNLCNIKDKLTPFYEIKTCYLNAGVILIAERKAVQDLSNDIKIYVVTHKKYKIMKDELYQPICVGTTYKNDHYLNDNYGDNIAYLNDKINECTAIYWIWKNTQHAYVGLNHYRRYFINNTLPIRTNYISKTITTQLLSTYDFIVATSVPFDSTVYDQLKGTISCSHLFDSIYEKFIHTIKQCQPDYLSSFHQVMNGYNFFRCNLFITSREIFNAYCEWLFSFLLPIAENTDLSDHSGTDRRIIGYFAERMLTVWLQKQNYRIIELPYTEV